MPVKIKCGGMGVTRPLDREALCQPTEGDDNYDPSAKRLPCNNYVRDEQGGYVIDLNPPNEWSDEEVIAYSKAKARQRREHVAAREAAAPLVPKADLGSLYPE